MFDEFGIHAAYLKSKLPKKDRPKRKGRPRQVHVLPTEPISWAEATAAGKKHYLTGKPCRHGHISARLVSSKQCVECSRRYQKTYKQP